MPTSSQVSEPEVMGLFDIHDYTHAKQLPVSEVAVVLRSAGLFCLQKDMEALLAGIPNVGKPNGALGQCATGTIYAQKEVGGSYQPVSDNLFANSTNPVARDAFQKFLKDKNIIAQINKTKGDSNHSHADGLVLSKEEQDVYNGFRAFDIKEHGFLTRSEVETVLRSANERIPPEDIAILLSQVFGGEELSHPGHGASKVNINQLAKHLMRPTPTLVKELTLPQTIGIANASSGLVPPNGVKCTPSQ